MRLSEKQREFTRLLARLIRHLDSLGYEITLGEAWRSPETQAIYAADGRGIGKSLHLVRLAIDLNLWRNNKYLTDPKEYEQAGIIWESYSTEFVECCWGGRFGDANHFSVGHGGVK